MSVGKFRIVTDTCIASGRCFAHEAKRLAETGVLEANDPRVAYASRGSSRPVLRSIGDCEQIWRQVIDADSPPELKQTLLLAKKALKGADTLVSPRDIAACLENAAVRLAGIGITGASSIGPGELIERAAIICDSVVLKERHCEEQESVAAIAQSSGVPPQRVLSGMLRMGLVDEKDHMVQAFIEGDLGDFNTLDRTAFLKAALEELKSAIRDFAPLGAPEEHRKDIARSLLRLNAAQESQANAVVKESDILNATAALAESFAKAFASMDRERAKRLAGLSMSASSRSHLIQEQDPEKFVIGGLKELAHQAN
ncbi:hypothetical protein [Sulfitobacter sp. 1A12779]|uniref:hypothetical protein n=1 Tax=Sulfitobacter sp. 1A12779 TaxID=3368599 RepID=UPI0037469784